MLGNEKLASVMLLSRAMSRRTILALPELLVSTDTHAGITLCPRRMLKAHMTVSR